MCKKAREAINNDGAKFMATFPGNIAKVILNWVTVNDLIEDVSINNEYEYENDFKPYSYDAPVQ